MGANWDRCAPLRWLPTHPHLSRNNAAAAAPAQVQGVTAKHAKARAISTGHRSHLQPQVLMERVRTRLGELQRARQVLLEPGLTCT